MKLTKKLNQLINSCITLTEEEVAVVEEFIHKQSRQVKPQHLNHYKCLAVARPCRTAL